MELQYWIWIAVGLSFSLYIGIAIWSRAGTTKEFYVAGGGVHPIANGMATEADWMSAASFISMAGIISFGGYDGSVYLMGWTGGYVLLALLLAPYLRKFGKITVPDFIGDRYYSNKNTKTRGSNKFYYHINIDRDVYFYFLLYWDPILFGLELLQNINK